LSPPGEGDVWKGKKQALVGNHYPCSLHVSDR
jgi:hypothetical protein